MGNILGGLEKLTKLSLDLENLYLKYTHKVWNKSPHHATCDICGKTIYSKDCNASPEECGWKRYDSWNWICHRCDSHRDFTPYVELTDIDEEIAWAKYDPSAPLEQLIMERDEAITRLLVRKDEV